MRIIRAFALILICNSCCSIFIGGTDDCIGDDFFPFKLLSKDGEDLFGGANPVYSVRDLRLYSIHKGERLNANLAYSSSGNGAELSVSLNYRFKTLFIEINHQTTDTLKFDFKADQKSCCTTIYHIKKFYDDGDEFDPPFTEPVEIRFE